MYNLKADPNEAINLASPYHNRTAFEQEQYVRLNRKLKEVKRTRLVPRKVENLISMTLNITSTAKGQQTGLVVGMPVGNANVTLTPEGSSIKVIISSGSGIIRGRATGGTVKFTSGTGTYQSIKGDLKFLPKPNKLIQIIGKALY